MDNRLKKGEKYMDKMTRSTDIEVRNIPLLNNIDALITCMSRR